MGEDPFVLFKEEGIVDRALPGREVEIGAPDEDYSRLEAPLADPAWREVEGSGEELDGLAAAKEETYGARGVERGRRCPFLEFPAKPEKEDKVVSSDYDLAAPVVLESVECGVPAGTVADLGRQAAECTIRQVCRGGLEGRMGGDVNDAIGRDGD
jgi:hypothetical protein